MKYWCDDGWIIIEGKSIIGEFFEKYRIAGTDDRMFFRDVVRDETRIVQVDQFNESEVSARGEGFSISIKFTPGKNFATVKLCINDCRAFLLGRDGLSGRLGAVSESLIKDLSWTKFLEDVFAEFKDSVSVEARGEDLSFTVARDGISVTCRYDLRAREWSCRAENIEFDWGLLNAEISPDVDSISEFFESF